MSKSLPKPDVAIKIPHGIPVGGILTVEHAGVHIVHLSQNPGAQGKTRVELLIVVRRQRPGIGTVVDVGDVAALGVFGTRKLVLIVQIARSRPGRHRAYIGVFAQNDVVAQPQDPQAGFDIRIFVAFRKKIVFIQIFAQKVDVAAGANPKDGKLTQFAIGEIKFERNIAVVGNGCRAYRNAYHVGQLYKRVAHTHYVRGVVFFVQRPFGHGFQATKCSQLEGVFGFVGIAAAEAQVKYPRHRVAIFSGKC